MNWENILKSNYEEGQRIERVLNQLEKLPVSKLHSKKKNYSGQYTNKRGREKRKGGETSHLSMEEIERMGFGWVEKFKVYPTKRGWRGHYRSDNSEMITGTKKLGDLIRAAGASKLKTKVYYTLDEDAPDPHDWGAGDKSSYVAVMYSKTEPKFEQGSD